MLYGKINKNRKQEFLKGGLKHLYCYNNTNILYTIKNVKVKIYE